MFVRVGMIALAGLIASTPSQAQNAFLDLDAPTLIDARIAVQTALEERPTGEAFDWNVSGVASGRVVPLRTWKSKSGHWCRAYEETIELVDSAAPYIARGIRCRAEDGRWRSP